MKNISCGRPAIFFIVAGIVLVLLSGCSGQESTLEIGFIGELSGSRLAPSLSMFKGVQLAFEERNEKGGIDGRKVRLISKDDGGIPSRGMEADRELINEKVVAIIGHPTSSTSAAALPLLNESKTVMISPTATADVLLGKDDYFFTMLSSNADLAETIAGFALKDLSLKRIAAVVDLSNQVYTKDYLEKFTDFFTEGGGEIIGEKGFTSNEPPNFQPIVKELLSLRPEGILVLASPIDTAIIAQQLFKEKASIPLLCCEWAANKDLILQGGPYTRNIYFAHVFNESKPSSSFRDFVRRYTKRYGEEPAVGSMLGYETAEVLFQALEKIKKRESLRHILLTEEFKGLEENLHFDKYGDIHRKIYIKTVRNNRFVVVR